MPILSAFGAARIISGSTQSSQPLTVSFLLVAGGGGSGGASISTRIGGGGGGGEVLETLNQAASTGVAYDIGVGVGGTASSTTPATNGGDSFYRSGVNATAKGGGKGGQAYATSNGYNGGTGGTGGGGYGAGTAGGVTSGSTGYAGGAGFIDASTGRPQGAAGGGAGGPPTVGSGVLSSYYVNGGAGKTSAITGLTYGGGGAGYSGTASAGGGVQSNGVNGRGGGAGGRSSSGTTNGYTGGSGVVVLKIPQQYTATFSGGVTSSVTTSAGFKIYTVTVAGAGQTVTFS